ncbi:MAG: polyribonucleotide nucleotidyltransferase [bacterium]|nr:polyribonucleotide nucleotidyltransferase [bacterium]
MKIIKKTANIGGREMSLEIGRFAHQATMAVLGQYGDTQVLATVMSSVPRRDLGYFPLSVDYMERLYAGGIIKGSRWMKREGRPTDENILTARLIDRSIRPLFPSTYKNDVQVIVTLLSTDKETDADVLSIIATSAAIATSSIPWDGPVGAVRMGYIDDKLVVNPSIQQRDLSSLDLVVSGFPDRVLMLEGGGNQVADEVFIEATNAALSESDKVINLINELVAEVKPTKQPIPEGIDKELISRMEKEFMGDINKLVEQASKLERKDENAMIDGIVEQAHAKFEEEFEKKDIAQVVDKLRKKLLRKNILETGIRVDGRKTTELRPLSSEVGILTRTHGSAVFQRGNTQALSVTTLGSAGEEQSLESANGEGKKRYMHHYSMPPFSVGETGRFGFPSRREIGHGALAERAIIPVLPSPEEFAYTIRVVSEILSSNGSTSMASVCGSTLSLMDAGVPIKAPVAGISTGIIVESDDKYVLLTDIMGIEDFNGDMDFKIAGTKDGITAVQLDVKIRGLTPKMVKETVERAKEVRMQILEHMAQTIAQPKGTVSQYAPQVQQLTIPEEKIGALIGPGGSVIKEIIATFEVDVNVEDDGTVNISGLNSEKVKQAADHIQNMMRELKVGDKFKGTVKRIVPFGAFVEVLPGREGLVHVSRMADKYVEDPSEIVKEGDIVDVTLFEIDDQGRINLTMVDNPKKEEGDRRPSRRDNNRGGNSRQDNYRGNNRRNNY